MEFEKLLSLYAPPPGGAYLLQAHFKGEGEAYLTKKRQWY